MLGSMSFDNNGLVGEFKMKFETEEPVYRCTSCGHIYMDEPTKCNCMPDEQTCEEGTAIFDDKIERLEAQLYVLQEEIRKLEAVIQTSNAMQWNCGCNFTTVDNRFEVG